MQVESIHPNALKYCPSCGSMIGINNRCSTCVKHYKAKRSRYCTIKKVYDPPLFKEAEEYLNRLDCQIKKISLKKKNYPREIAKEKWEWEDFKDAAPYILFIVAGFLFPILCFIFM